MIRATRGATRRAPHNLSLRSVTTTAVNNFLYASPQLQRTTLRSFSWPQKFGSKPGRKWWKTNLPRLERRVVHDEGTREVRFGRSGHIDKVDSKGVGKEEVAIGIATGVAVEREPIGPRQMRIARPQY